MIGEVRYILNPPEFDNWVGLHKLLSECFAYMEEKIDPPSSLSRMTPENLRDKSSQDTLLIVLHKDQLIACAFFEIREDVVYVGKVAVRNSHRRRGITRKVIDLASEFAIEKGKFCLELQARIELTDNHQTFGRLGFVKTGEDSHEGFNRPTSITMQKTI